MEPRQHRGPGRHGRALSQARVLAEPQDDKLGATSGDGESVVEIAEEVVLEVDEDQRRLELVGCRRLPRAVHPGALEDCVDGRRRRAFGGTEGLEEGDPAHEEGRLDEAPRRRMRSDEVAVRRLAGVCAGPVKKVFFF